jgi:glycosyltransferase involved in cell wall biosynthesis
MKTRTFLRTSDSTMLRVLFNTPSPTLQGGLATCVPLLQSGLEPYVQLDTFQYGGVSERETVFTKFWRTIFNLARAEIKLLRKRPDLIHLNSAFDRRSILRDAPLAILAYLHRIPLVLMVHGSHAEFVRPTTRTFDWIKSVLVRSVSLVCVLSTAEKAEFEQFMPELKGRVRVVKNVISDLFLNTSRSETPDPLVLFASRFIKRKGPFQLLAAVPSINAGVPTARFVFLGDGTDAQAFDEEVRRRELSGIVERISYVSRDEISTWYSRAWVLVFPTFFPEGMPMVVAEAMATGTPIVTTRTRFCRSYNLEPKSCLCCDPNDPQSIAQQVTALLTNPVLRREMSESNRSFARQFRQDVVAREFLELYERLCRPIPQVSSAVLSTDQPIDQ